MGHRPLNSPLIAFLQKRPAEEAELTRQMREFWAQYPRHAVKQDRRTGTTSLVVAPHSISTSVATRNADGKLVWTCAEGNADLDARIANLRTATPPPAVEGDR